VKTADCYRGRVDQGNERLQLANEEVAATFPFSGKQTTKPARDKSGLGFEGGISGGTKRERIQDAQVFAWTTEYVLDKIGPKISLHGVPRLLIYELDIGEIMKCRPMPTSNRDCQLRAQSTEHKAET